MRYQKYLRSESKKTGAYIFLLINYKNLSNMRKIVEMTMQHGHKKVLQKIVMGMMYSLLIVCFSGMQMYANDFSETTVALQQGVVVTGVVIDDSGDPLPGVNVMVKGTATGVSTGSDGSFSITVPDRNAYCNSRISVFPFRR